MDPWMEEMNLVQNLLSNGTGLDSRATGRLLLGQLTACAGARR